MEENVDLSSHLRSNAQQQLHLYDLHGKRVSDKEAQHVDMPKLLNYNGWTVKIADLHAFIDWGSLSPALCEFLCKSLREGLDDQCMLYKYHDVKISLP